MKYVQVSVLFSIIETRIFFNPNKKHFRHKNKTGKMLLGLRETMTSQFWIFRLLQIDIIIDALKSKLSKIVVELKQILIAYNYKIKLILYVCLCCSYTML